MSIDRIDIALLAALTRNARATHVELAEQVGLSSTACARRLKLLEENGLITGYHATLGLKQLGFSTTVIVRITLDSQSEEALNAFEKAVARCPSVVHCLLMSGDDDYLLTVLARDIEDFEHIHKGQLSTLPRVARIHSSFAIREVTNRPVPPTAIEHLRRAAR
ncbi:Lrp/AsnC family transcriptional regulator [Vineibacter terrae]|uniref:Lrp/AsnC family transcriptional regulator n=1 Tax=Vineibacter terrae TaxID=2586908 RepID=A0A5C8PF85_9HYPH|nr:Lrp/AsnC family transcriptional regulator [Vineibacter terrae]TXL71998.1 Lrp/AsnC family transcriptional regulator [Vineibacter terrae]HEX2887837.1 Lrp/AsnC family transcriptional regulator [Vineibacter terrae]